MPGVIEFGVSDHVATITLNRPDKLNALNEEVRQGLSELVRRANAEPAVRVIVIRGAGEKAFCAGADIDEMAMPATQAEMREIRKARSWHRLIETSRVPTIASIHGFCLGGGLEMALACDIRIAADDAQFALPETRLGIMPGAGGTQRLPRIIGVARALEIVLTGDRINAATAERYGLVHAVVPRAELAGETLRWAGRLGQGAPLAVAYAREAVRRGIEATLEEGLQIEADLATMLQGTEDRAEGIAAFREKRKARYHGK